MIMLRTCCTLVSVFAVFAVAVKWSGCPEEHVLAQINQVDYHCEHDPRRPMDCFLRPGTTVTLSVNFKLTTNHSINTFWADAKPYLILPGVQSQNVYVEAGVTYAIPNGNMSETIVPNKEITYTNILPVIKVNTTLAMNIKWSVFDGHNATILCFYTPIRIVPKE